MKENRGITLIALVITIIVLLILAGVSLRLVAGNEGILNRAEKAVSKSNTESLKEEIELAISELRIAYYEDKEGFASADEYIEGKLSAGKQIPSGTIKLEGETLKLEGKEIGTYSPENGLTVNNSLTGENTNTGAIGTREDWEIDDNGVLSRYIGQFPESGKIIVPAEVDGIKVIETKSMGNSVGKYTCIFHDESVWQIGSIYNNNIRAVVFSEGIQKITGYTCGRMKMLKEVTISSTVVEIGNYQVFAYCDNLTTVNVVGNNLEKIGSGTFEACNSLKDVNYGGTIADWNSISIGVGNTPLTKATIHCTDGDILPQS